MAKSYQARDGQAGVAMNYAKIIGVVVLLIGVVGLILGDANRLLGLFNIDLVEDIIHLGTGGLMAYVGFLQRDNGLARTVSLRCYRIQRFHWRWLSAGLPV